MSSPSSSFWLKLKRILKFKNASISYTLEKSGINKLIQFDQNRLIGVENLNPCEQMHLSKFSFI